MNEREQRIEQLQEHLQAQYERQDLTRRSKQYAIQHGYGDAEIASYDASLKLHRERIDGMIREIAKLKGQQRRMDEILEDIGWIKS